MRPIRFSKSYIDELFDRRDISGLHHLITLRSREKDLPEEFWLFCRMVEWGGSTRSGVWQYYEGLSEDLFSRATQALDRFELPDIAEQYRSGWTDWNKPDHAAHLDAWIDRHEQQIENAAFGLIVERKEWLYES